MTATSWIEEFKPWLERVLKLKKRMIEKNLVIAKAKCLPTCNGLILARLAGPKKHIHARCSECKRTMME